MIITTLIVLVCLLLGFMAGRVWERERHRLARSKEPKPVCGCKHHYALHNADGTCHKMVAQGTNWVPCQCQRYTGPEPLPRMISGGG